MKWSRQRWVLMTCLIFAAQVGAIFGLHTREPLRVRLPEIEPLRPGGFTTNSLPTDADEVNDPLIFAGAHPQGFSGAAWLMAPKSEVSFSNSVAAPAFLEFQASRSEIAVSNRPAAISSALPFVQLSPPKEATRQSLLLVEGGLAARKLRNAPVVPLQYGAEVLSPTVVQVAVEGDGFPQSARVISGSGSRGADATALQIVNGLRFERAAPNEPANKLQWGNLIFQWATTEAPSTNAPAAAAK
jgi:TonB family protein